MEKETIWRVQEDDIRVTLKDRYPNLSEDQVETIIANAHESFEIPDFADYLNAFVDNEVENL